MYKQLMNCLLSNKSVALFVHTNPDWDCVGSAFALRNVLRAKGVLCNIFTEDPLMPYLGFLGDDVICYTENASAPDYDCYCAVDVGSAKRIGMWGKFFEGKTNTVCIDHHPPFDEFCAVRLIEPQRSSSAELVYEMMYASGIGLTKEVAQFLYCAISSDSGSFQYSNVSRRTYEIVIDITDTGIDTAYLCSMLYERNTLNRLYLKADAIYSLRTYKDGTIATAHITNETLSRYNATKADTEGFSNLPRTIDGVKISAFFTELPGGEIRVSLRSEGDINIQPVARYFGGGGHAKASGFTLPPMPMEDAQAMVVNELIKL